MASERNIALHITSDQKALLKVRSVVRMTVRLITVHIIRDEKLGKKKSELRGFKMSAHGR